MYKRLIILSVIIFSALMGMVVLGYYALDKWAEGMEGARLGDFAEVAEQIRAEMNRKLEEFRRQEENRPYTHYQFYYVPDQEPDSRQRQQVAVVQSPLVGKIENLFAYGYFQISPDGKVSTPSDELSSEDKQVAYDADFFKSNYANIDNIYLNVVPVLEREGQTYEQVLQESQGQMVSDLKESKDATIAGSTTEPVMKKEAIVTKEPVSKGDVSDLRRSNLAIESLQAQQQEGAKVISQNRDVAERNVLFNEAVAQQQLDAVTEMETPVTDSEQTSLQKMRAARTATIQRENAKAADVNEPVPAESQKIGYEDQSAGQQMQAVYDYGIQADDEQAMDRLQLIIQEPVQAEPDTVQIRIEPFVPIVVGGDGEDSIFGGQVFYLRHVNIEDKHFIQGFKLNEERLIEEINTTATSLLREGMDYELSQTERPTAAYTAILDFGFGSVVLNFIELVPDWIEKDIRKLQYWYFGTVAFVFIAVTLGLGSLWRNARAQLKLAEKKDDFISAVSHELRTPLTSIRMYSEMLEKGWVKSEEKGVEYYRNMRQESERLSRLIENVLDFSRIQKKRKKYSFNLGDINHSISQVVEMMRPFAGQNGFSIVADFGKVGQVRFDRDALTQIVVNLLDNAIKYAKDAEDKTIGVRTSSDDGFVLIEVEDHGPGVPHRQRKKIFEEFYRIGSESTRETKGTGLGLALVKRFAQAHNGFVEILSAKPHGAIFRVALAIKM